MLRDRLLALPVVGGLERRGSPKQLPRAANYPQLVGERFSRCVKICCATGCWLYRSLAASNDEDRQNRCREQQTTHNLLANDFHGALKYVARPAAGSTGRWRPRMTRIAKTDAASSKLPTTCWRTIFTVR